MHFHRHAFLVVRRLAAGGLLLIAALLVGCAEPDAPSGAPGAAATRADTSFKMQYTAPILQAHAADAWNQQGAFATDITMRFGGRTALDGQLFMEPDMGRTRLELGGDTVAVFDGTDAWVAPDTNALPRARFQLLTAPYFTAAPYKLRDPGTRLEDRGTLQMDGQPYAAARMTFAPGTGDSPDDWYMLYRDPQTDRLHAMAYVVTYGRRADQEEPLTPNAIVYSEYTDVDGVPVPTTWTYYRWSEENGLEGDPTGTVVLENPHFMQPSDSTFAAPEGAQRAARP